MKPHLRMKLSGCEVAGSFTCGSKLSPMKCFLLLWIVMVGPKTTNKK